MEAGNSFGPSEHLLDRAFFLRELCKVPSRPWAAHPQRHAGGLAESIADVASGVRRFCQRHEAAPQDIKDAMDQYRAVVAMLVRLIQSHSK